MSARRDGRGRPEIARALQYVAAHLEEPLALADVAKVARLSEFHFHRLFTQAVGEPLGRFVTRRRLEIAALRLAYEPHRSVTDVALGAGYSSLSNFGKAFSAHFGCSPSEVRHGSTTRAVGRLTERHGKDFTPAELFALPPDLDPAERARRAAALDPRYETTAGLSFACLSSAGGYDLGALTDTWTSLLGRARALGLCEGPVDAWGIAHDSPQLTAPEACRYDACVPCPPGAALPAPLFAGRLPPGRYAVFAYRGPVAGVAERYREIFSTWVPERRVELADYAAFDRYVGDEPEGDQVDMEMWLRLAR